MTGTFRVAWTADALDDWRRLPLAAAREVAQAVQRFVEGEGGIAAYVADEYRLFVGARVVAMLIDRETIYVLGVRRA